MNKNNFLLVDLSESKTKKLAETIASDVSVDDVVIYMSSGDVSKKVNLLKQILNEKV